MTPAFRIEELEKLLGAASDGGWSVAPEGTYPADEGSKVLGPQKHNSRGHPVRYYTAQFCTPEDAAFIAAIKNAAPGLLACAKALEEIASQPTGGVGANPEGYVRLARAALALLAGEKGC